MALCFSQNSKVCLFADWKLQSFWFFSKTEFIYFLTVISLTYPYSARTFFLSKQCETESVILTACKFTFCHSSVPWLEKGETTCLLLSTATSVPPEFLYLCLNIWNTIHPTMHFKSLRLYSCSIILQVNCLFFFLLGGSWFIDRC